MASARCQGVRMRCPFTLFKSKTGIGLIWYARYWNEKAQKYTVARSTGIIAEGKKERRREAELRAKEMLSEIRFETDAADCLFISYLENFWKPDSLYVKEQTTLKKKPLSAYYVQQNEVNVNVGQTVLLHCYIYVVVIGINLILEKFYERE